ncbi:hypothetical protein G6F37_004745 [Rhizopus arrhizus]|nr:hypothetical protein G6F38_001489 [Rhizopus arrhizus]KAG1159608.1 hypothetical protein G6F37_004745 [Rhizopus arrhizus]
MSNYVSKSYYSANELLLLSERCQNITAGLDKYQMFCQSLSNTAGGCYSMPSKYMNLDGSIDCFEVTSQPFLEKLYAATGNACGISCYYHRDSILNPTIPIPTFSYPINTITNTPGYTTPSAPIRITTALASIETFSVVASSPAAKSTSAAGSGSSSNTSSNSEIGSGSSSNDGSSGGIIPALGGSSISAASSTLAPNVILTFMLIFLVMNVFMRKSRVTI